MIVTLMYGYQIYYLIQVKGSVSKGITPVPSVWVSSLLYWVLALGYVSYNPQICISVEK